MKSSHNDVAMEFITDDIIDTAAEDRAAMNSPLMPGIKVKT